MTNEEKILALLGQMQTDMSDLKAGQGRLEKDVTALKADVSELKTGQAKLETDVAELKDNVAGLNLNVKYLWGDIERLSGRMVVQEDIVRKKIM